MATFFRPQARLADSPPGRRLRRACCACPSASAGVRALTCPRSSSRSPVRLTGRRSSQRTQTMSPAVTNLMAGPIRGHQGFHGWHAVMAVRKPDIRALRLTATRSRDSSLCRAAGRDRDVSPGGCLDAVYGPHLLSLHVHILPGNRRRSPAAGPQVPRPPGPRSQIGLQSRSGQWEGHP